MCNMGQCRTSRLILFFMFNRQKIFIPGRRVFRRLSLQFHALLRRPDAVGVAENSNRANRGIVPRAPRLSQHWDL